MNGNKQTRREFFKRTGAGAALAALSPLKPVAASTSTAAGDEPGLVGGATSCVLAPGSQSTGESGKPKSRPLTSPPELIEKLGLASYTTRELTLTETILWAKELGLTHLSLKDFHLPLKATSEQFAQVKDLVKKAGLDFYAVGVIYMKTKDEVAAAFEYAKNAGVRMIVGVPAHDLVDETERKIKEVDIAVAIHNHGPSDQVYPTCESAFKKIDGRDPRFGLCLDIGHTFRSGEDPADVYKKFHRRILDIHLKDVDLAEAKGTTVEIGRGKIDIPAFLKTVQGLQYGGNLSFEYEKDGPQPIPGLAESVGYVRGVIRGL